MKPFDEPSFQARVVRDGKDSLLIANIRKIVKNTKMFVCLTHVCSFSIMFTSLVGLYFSHTFVCSCCMFFIDDFNNYFEEEVFTD